MYLILLPNVPICTQELGPISEIKLRIIVFLSSVDVDHFCVIAEELCVLCNGCHGGQSFICFPSFPYPLMLSFSIVLNVVGIETHVSTKN